MNANFLDLDLPTDAPLPSQPPSDPDALQRWQAERLADFYQSPHFKAWYQRTLETKHCGAPFILD